MGGEKLELRKKNLALQQTAEVLDLDSTLRKAPPLVGLPRSNAGQRKETHLLRISGLAHKPPAQIAANLSYQNLGRSIGVQRRGNLLSFEVMPALPERFGNRLAVRDGGATNHAILSNARAEQRRTRTREWN